MEELKIKCPAKVNLVLSVPNRLSDGYHEIVSVMQAVGLYDEITVKKAEGITVVSEKSPCGEENICYKAAMLFSAFGGAKIKIEKNIPLLSGLGGGSSDAAGVMLALNCLYGEPFSRSELIEKALSLGSDVPFFIKGGTALIEGKGEKLTPCADYAAHIVLIKHGKKLSTGEMYGALDRKGLKDHREKVYDFCESLAAGKQNKLFNDFERVFPCEDIKNALTLCGAVDACLSGSGPTVFGVFSSEQKARECVNTLCSGYSEVYYCPAVKGGIIFE